MNEKEKQELTIVISNQNHLEHELIEHIAEDKEKHKLVISGQEKTNNTIQTLIIEFAVFKSQVLTRHLCCSYIHRGRVRVNRIRCKGVAKMIVAKELADLIGRHERLQFTRVQRHGWNIDRRNRP